MGGRSLNEVWAPSEEKEATSGFSCTGDSCLFSGGNVVESLNPSELTATNDCQSDRLESIEATEIPLFSAIQMTERLNSIKYEAKSTKSAYTTTTQTKQLKRKRLKLRDVIKKQFEESMKSRRVKKRRRRGRRRGRIIIGHNTEFDDREFILANLKETTNVRRTKLRNRIWKTNIKSTLSFDRSKLVVFLSSIILISFVVQSKQQQQQQRQHEQPREVRQRSLFLPVAAESSLETSLDERRKTTNSVIYDRKTNCDYNTSCLPSFVPGLNESGNATISESRSIYEESAYSSPPSPSSFPSSSTFSSSSSLSSLSSSQKLTKNSLDMEKLDRGNYDSGDFSDRDDNQSANQSNSSTAQAFTLKGFQNAIGGGKDGDDDGAATAAASSGNKLVSGRYLVDREAPSTVVTTTSMAPALYSPPVYKCNSTTTIPFLQAKLCNLTTSSQTSSTSTSSSISSAQYRYIPSNETSKDLGKNKLQSEVNERGQKITAKAKQQSEKTKTTAKKMQLNSTIQSLESIRLPMVWWPTWSLVSGKEFASSSSSRDNSTSLDKLANKMVAVADIDQVEPAYEQEKEKKSSRLVALSALMETSHGVKSLSSSDWSSGNFLVREKRQTSAVSSQVFTIDGSVEPSDVDVERERESREALRRSSELRISPREEGHKIGQQQQQQQQQRQNQQLKDSSNTLKIAKRRHKQSQRKLANELDEPRIELEASLSSYRSSSSSSSLKHNYISKVSTAHDGDDQHSDKNVNSLPIDPGFPSATVTTTTTTSTLTSSALNASKTTDSTTASATAAISENNVDPLNSNNNARSTFANRANRKRHVLKRTTVNASSSKESNEVDKALVVEAVLNSSEKRENEKEREDVEEERYSQRESIGKQTKQQQQQQQITMRHEMRPTRPTDRRRIDFSEQNSNSELDQIIPSYYHNLIHEEPDEQDDDIFLVKGSRVRDSSLSSFTWSPSPTLSGSFPSSSSSSPSSSSSMPQALSDQHWQQPTFSDNVSDELDGESGDKHGLLRRRTRNGEADEEGEGVGGDEEVDEDRYKRSSLKGGAKGHVQTIYFGGFFPWLTDELPSNRLQAGNDGRMSQQQQQQQQQPHNYYQTKKQQQQQSEIKPTSLNSMPATMINGNQEHQLEFNQLKKKKKQQQQQHQPTTTKQVKRQKQEEHYENASSILLSTLNNPTSASTLISTNSIIKNTNINSNINSHQQYTATSSSTSENRHQLGRFILPAVRLALDHINNNNSVLGSYKLEIVPRDTQCNATISLKEFFDMVYEEPKKMLLYGDACRVSTDPIAKASYFFDLIQISYADTDPIYTIENYPNFFRVVPSENALSLARIPFIRHFNWTRVGTIYQNLPRYSLPHSKLLTDLERFNIVIKQSVSLPGSVDGLQNRDLGDELRKLKEKDVRIILGNFDEEWALLLFCEAFREKMTGRKYQWILTGVSEDKLWHYYKSKGSFCSEQELLIAMDGYIITDITPVTRSQHPTISGMMAHEYSNEYKRRAQEMNISIDENKFYGYVYDGIWAIALALHQVDYKLKYYNRLAEIGRGKLNPEIKGLTSLLDFDYHKPIWVKLIRSALNRTKFNGVTGTVSFHKNERPGLISFSQFQAFRGMSEVIIGSYDALNDNLDLKVGFPISWRGPSPPIDYTIQRVTPFRINRTLFVIISILALFGIVLAFIFLTINIKFRNQRYIKMSSPYLNNLIIIGCILTYTSVIILGLDSGLTSEYNFPYICNARAWVLMAGFTLAFGSMFSKTFRVHSIFTNIKLHKKVIKDYKLFMVVFILLTFDVCILIVWQYFDPFYRETNNGTSIQDSDNEDVIIVPEMEHCQSKRMTIFLSVIYVYKGLLMAFGCFLAWETRHVSIPALNDSKYIGLSVYNVVIMCVIGASLSFVLRDQQDASFVIISIFIIFCSTTTLCLVFVPKILELKQNPRAGDHRVRATLKTFKKNYREEALGCRDIHGNIIGRGYSVNLNERIKILLEENVKQRSVLKEKTYELEALTYKYRKIQTMVQSGQYLQALNTTTAATSFGQISSSQSQDVTNKVQTTTASASLKSRSPTHGPVSFSLLKDNDQSNLVKMIPTTNELVDNERMALDDDNLKSGSLRKSPLMSSATQITTTNTTSSTNNTTDLTNDYSSSKCIVTPSTNGITTNQTNLNEQQQQQQQQIGKRTLVAFDCVSGRKDDNNGGAISTSNTNLNRQSVIPNYTQNLMSCSQNQQHLPLVSGGSTQSMKKLQGGAAGVGGLTALDYSQNNSSSSNYNNDNRKQSPKYTTDSSYCSMGAEFEISGEGSGCNQDGGGGDIAEDGGRVINSYSKRRKSQDDLDLFTVFHNIAANKQPIRKRLQSAERESAENTFTRWSEGPFCTLMVRNNEQHMKNYSLKSQELKIVPGRVVAQRSGGTLKRSVSKERYIDKQQQPSQQSKYQEQPSEGDIRASCPDIATSKTQMSPLICGPPTQQQQQQVARTEIRNFKAKEQMSQQMGGQNSLSKKSINKSANLHRTISMIEYLGLDEFEMIAKRHEKLLKQKQSMMIRKQSSAISCCYEINECNCCDISSSSINRRVTTCRQMRSLNQSEADIYSSNDRVNSTGFQQTSSRFSCSTCCSLASQTYPSQSEFMDDDASSQSISSQTVSSTSGSSESSAQQNSILNSASQSSRSSSVILDQLGHQQQDYQVSRYCQHHSNLYKSTSLSDRAHQQHQHQHHRHHHHQQTQIQQQQQHHHHHHHSHHRLSEQNSSFSSSSSLCQQPAIINNQQAKGAKSTASSSSSKQIAPPPPTTTTATQQELSLCTSGHLFCAPSAKEGANEAAQIIHQSSLTSEGRIKCVKHGAASSSINEEDLTPTVQQKDGTNIEQQQQQEEAEAESFLIKCDVLESL